MLASTLNRAATPSSLSIEAGFFPRVAFYLAYWFPRRHRAKAMATFFFAQILCSLLGAPISGLVMDHIAWFNLSGWRCTIVLKGFPAILLGIGNQSTWSTVRAK